MTEWTRIREIFVAAVDLDADARRTLLDELCADDQELRKSVEELLSADTADHSVMIENQAPFELAEGRSTRIKRVGDYEILRLLGSGGMGTVFEATQQSPKRSVAVKILRSLLVTEQARRRFEYEAETLARLHHPNIAQIHEAGAWQDPDSGEDCPFFAMEFVHEAKPLDQFANDAALDLRSRLELFLQVCDAVEHGHLQGILHRDIKPGNILVGADGLPKVIDFGIARSADASQDQRSMRTFSGQVMGTLAYMSPEQLSGDATSVDLRSDLYSLAATLYELLAGHPPHERGEESIPSFIAQVCERPPAAPSMAASELQLPAELDWIILKALESEKNRRYSTVSEFAADLERFLRNEPVTARAQTTAYLLRKFVHRHRSLVTTVAAATVLLIASTLVAIKGWVEADHNMQIARMEAGTQQAVTNYTRRLIERARQKGGAREITMLEVLDQSDEVLDELAQGQANVALSLRLAAANFYLDLMHPEKALPLLEQGIEETTSRLASQHADVLSAKHSLGLTLINLDRYEEGIDCLKKVLRDRIATQGANSRTVAETRQVLGAAFCDIGDFEAAEQQLIPAIEIFEAVVAAQTDRSTGVMSPVHWLVLSRTGLASALESSGKYAEA